MANIAIFGGTFNPFHIGHYEMLKVICELSYIDKVFLMPDKIPPHKAFDNIVSDAHRQNMCAIACEDFNKAQLCLIEFEREGKSYTIDTINLIKKEYPDDKLYVVIGGDMLATLDTWYNWQGLFKKVSFLAFRREGEKEFDESYQRLTKLGADIGVINNQITDVSSTKLRKKIESKLLPPKIYEYILKKGIYNV